TGLPNGTYHRRYTTDTNFDVALSDVTVSSGSPSFTTTMPASGIVTIFQDRPGPFYASPAGSGASCSLSSPCDIRTVLSGNSGAIPSGSLVYLRGGNYSGKFTASVSGSADAPITFLAYPGEWVKLDGYVTTTLTGAINNSTTSITVADGSKFDIGTTLNFHDAANESSEETVSVTGRSGNVLTVVRGWKGTTAASHSSGATCVLGGNQLVVTGSNLI